MTEERKSRFAVINNSEAQVNQKTTISKPNDSGYHSNPMYQKLLNFRNLQEQQKKKFSVEDLLKW